MSANNTDSRRARSQLNAASAPRSNRPALAAMLEFANAVNATTGPALVLDARSTAVMQWKGTAQAVDLGELPAQRSLEFRPKQKTEGVDAQTRTGYMEAAKAQIVGHPPASPCSRCANGSGPFTSCQVVDHQRSDGDFFLNKGCANCYYGDQTGNCTFRIRYNNYPQ